LKPRLPPGRKSLEGRGEEKRYIFQSCEREKGNYPSETEKDRGTHRKGRRGLLGEEGVAKAPLIREWSEWRGGVG